MSNTVPEYPHGPPETEQERQDLLKRLRLEQHGIPQRGAQAKRNQPKWTPPGYEQGPIPPNGGYTAPTDRRNGAGQTPNNPHNLH